MRNAHLQYFDYYVIRKPALMTWRQFAVRIKNKLVKNAGPLEFRRSVTGNLALVRVDKRGGGIGDMNNARGPMDSTQMWKYIEANKAQWEPSQDEHVIRFSG